MDIFNLKKSTSERGFLSGIIELPSDRAHWSVTLLFILLAYLLIFGLIWNGLILRRRAI